MKRLLLIFLLLISGIAIYFVVNNSQKITPNNQISEIKLSSSAFENNQNLPIKFTCQGEGAIPPLAISSIPPNAQSLAIILKDPDAPGKTFIHWLIWNISPNAKEILENTIPEGAIQGKNSINENFYFSPCPHTGKHHYIFYLYALDTTLTLPPEATLKEFEMVTTGHILGATTLTGIFP